MNLFRAENISQNRIKFTTKNATQTIENKGKSRIPNECGIFCRWRSERDSNRTTNHKKYCNFNCFQALLPFLLTFLDKNNPRSRYAPVARTILYYDCSVPVNFRSVQRDQHADGILAEVENCRVALAALAAQDALCHQLLNRRQVIRRVALVRLDVS